MDFRIEPAGLYARALALISLFFGLSDAGRLLGIGGGSMSPILALGPAGFVLLSALSVCRLFAAVGLWMQVRWGAILLAGSLGAELAFLASGSGWIASSLYGFIFKLVVLLATILLLVLAHFLNHRQVAD